MSELTVAESAFVNAIIKVIEAQIAMYDLGESFKQLDEQAQRANEAVIKEKSYSNDTPVPELLDAQQRYLEAAIDRGEFDTAHPVIEILRGQFEEAREGFAAWQSEQIQGPVL